MPKSQILSNIIHHIEYYSDYTGGSARYPTFSIAYLVYSTSHCATLVDRLGRAFKEVPPPSVCLPAIQHTTADDFQRRKLPPTVGRHPPTIAQSVQQNRQHRTPIAPTNVGGGEFDAGAGLYGV